MPDPVTNSRHPSASETGLKELADNIQAIGLILPLAVRPVAEFGVDVTPRLTIEKVSPPAERPGGKLVGSADELIAALKGELSELEAL